MKQLLGLMAAFAASACAADTGEWKRIFDGRSLDGWTPKISGHVLGEDPLRTFRVADGAIQVSYDGYDGFKGRFGHLAYDKPVGAFRVRFQYRFTGKPLAGVEDWQHSNSGIMLLGQAPQTMTLNQSFPVSLEMQLLGAERPEPAPSGNLCTPGTHVVIAGKLETTHCINSSSPVLPNGRWIDAEAEVTRDGQVTHVIAGQPVLRYSAPQFDPADADARPLLAAAGGKLSVSGGYLYLQSEGHPVEFRNIELLELE